MSEPVIEQPQTDSNEGWRQAHWAFIGIQMVRNLRPAVVPLVILLATRGGRDGIGQWIFFGITALAFLIATGASLVDWWFYHYRVTNQGIEVRSGVISKQERSVPFERIQSVDLIEAPLDRFFQVVKVRIETAATGDNADLEIRALTRSDAADLRQRLIRARQRSTQSEIATETEQDQTSETLRDSGELVRTLSTRELLIAGATSGRIGPALAIVGIASQFASDLVPRSIWEKVPLDDLADAAQSFRVLALAVVVFGLFAWLLAIATTVLTYSGFTVRKDACQLYVEHGLLDRRRLTIPVRRVQAVRVVESMLRQPFGYAELKFDSAGRGGGDDEGARGVLFPMLPTRELVNFLEQTVPDFVMDLEHPRLETLPRRARSRYILAATVGWVVAVLIVAIVGAVSDWFPIWWPLLGLLAVPGFVWFGHLRFRDAGWVIERERLMLRWRAVSRVTVLTRLGRLQHRAMTSNPFQRRSRLVTFRAAVASGSGGAGFAIPHLDERQAEQLMIRTGSGRTFLNPNPEQFWPAQRPLPAADASTS